MYIKKCAFTLALAFAVLINIQFLRASGWDTSDFNKGANNSPTANSVISNNSNITISGSNSSPRAEHYGWDLNRVDESSTNNIFNGAAAINSCGNLTLQGGTINGNTIMLGRGTISMDNLLLPIPIQGTISVGSGTVNIDCVTKIIDSGSVMSINANTYSGATIVQNSVLQLDSSLVPLTLSDSGCTVIDTIDLQDITGDGVAAIDGNGVMSLEITPIDGGILQIGPGSTLTLASAGVPQPVGGLNTAPEPSTIVMLGMAAMALIFAIRSRKFSVV
jgi:hypothetical protein